MKDENSTPVAVGFSDLILLQGFAKHYIPIAALFTDPEGDPLTLPVATSDDMTIEAAFANDTLTLTERGLGVDTIIIIAADEFGMQAADTFLVTVASFDNAFMTTWKTTADESITIPTKGGNEATDYDFWIDWGDDTPPENATGDNPDLSHTYDTAGTFTVKITGTFPYFYLNNNAEIKDKLLSVKQWGNIAWENMASMFYGASNLTLNAIDTPDLSSVTDMSEMFRSASAFDQDISGWNVSSVEDMSEMFRSASAFDQDISGWNVSSVEDMFGMFSDASAFDQNISDWKVSNVTDMSFMFFNASVFNQDISGWNVSSVTDMEDMLSGSSLSTYHYEELLIAWNKLELQKSVTLGAEDKQYRARAQTARDSLVSFHNWSIDDDGLKDENNTPVAVDFSDLVLLQGFPSYKIPINSLFTDPDGDVLKLTVTTDGDMAIAASFENNTLTLTESGAGVDTVYLTVNDIINEAVQVRDTFLVTVEENVPPRITKPLADLILEKNFETLDIDLSNTFEDEDPLIFSVTVASPEVLSFEVSGDSLTLTEIDTGSTNIIVTASDGLLVTTDTFLVTVKNNLLRVTNPLADITLNNGFRTHDIDLSNTFEYDQPLTYSVMVTSAGVASAAISGNTLTLTEVGAGITSVTVTASDGLLVTTDTFLLTIENVPPRIANALADLTLEKDFETHEIDLSNVFEDEQPLTFSLIVATTGVITTLISGDTLTLTEVGTGITSVMVTANDGALQTTDTFLVTIENTPLGLPTP